MEQAAVEGVLKQCLSEEGSKLQQCLEAMKQAGCKVGPDYFKVMPCGALRAVGGYSQQQGVILCHDQLQTPSQVTSTALHELLHAYDDCRAGAGGLDWADCQTHACAEVRAAALSGDCDLQQEIWRGKVEVTRPSSWFDVHAKCVARRATLSVQLNPNCQGEGVAAKAVADVIARCMADRAPFVPPPNG
ncbi:peptidase M76 [Dunaliella salina]|uniref:Mitochondrial inner membrane protease ATP23 n=1 Tax=Dunaliella salina TaxID=3046 RepID=A0ABQ7GYV1_DUNSA|nr:peptidase M76 [Dunaliella salina]|eukprot:KAF5839781.1 peptidase M76 [Dunaliella salina]